MFSILSLGKSKSFHLQAIFTVALVTTLQGDKHSQEAFTRPVAEAKNYVHIFRQHVWSEKLQIYEFQVGT